VFVAACFLIYIIVIFQRVIHQYHQGVNNSVYTIPTSCFFTLAPCVVFVIFFGLYRLKMKDYRAGGHHRRPRLQFQASIFLQVEGG